MHTVAELLLSGLRQRQVDLQALQVSQDYTIRFCFRNKTRKKSEDLKLGGMSQDLLISVLNHQAKFQGNTVCWGRVTSLLTLWKRKMDRLSITSPEYLSLEVFQTVFLLTDFRLNCNLKIIIQNPECYNFKTVKQLFQIFNMNNLCCH